MTHETSRIDIATATAVPALQPQIAPYVKLGGKRALDILGALVFMALLTPVVAFFWWRVRSDGGPGFYSQPRMGRNGVVFDCWKLRSMCVDAEARLAEYIATDPIVASEWQNAQKLKKDPRITAVGRIIRRYSIDELPQLWNVLRGDMSLIGPRPFMVSQAELYPVTGRTAYYAMRPGITGLWQVSARNDESFVSRARYDVTYREKVSLWADLRIALKTVYVMFCGTGQ